MFMRLILYIYMNQKCNVKCCGKLSNSFRVKNGDRQGVVSSGILFAVYMDYILTLLSRVNAKSFAKSAATKYVHLSLYAVNTSNNWIKYREQDLISNYNSYA